MTDTNPPTKEEFEKVIRRLTRNERVITALLKCFETKKIASRAGSGLYYTDLREFNTVADWVVKKGWLK